MIQQLTPLLSLQEQQAIKPISKNNDRKYEGIALEVENSKLRELIGAAFLYDIQKNPENYTNLLEGVEFTDCNGNAVQHRGLKYVLAYLNYASYVTKSFIQDTYTGLKQKNIPESEAVSDGTIKRLQLDAQNIAMSEWAMVKEYIELNSKDYPLFSCSSATKKHFTPRITTIRKTIR